MKTQLQDIIEELESRFLSEITVTSHDKLSTGLEIAQITVGGKEISIGRTASGELGLSIDPGPFTTGFEFVFSPHQSGKLIETIERGLPEISIAELRKVEDVSQVELADRMDIAQATLSKLENQKDMRLSTLQRTVEALGGELELVVRFAKGIAKIRVGD